MTTPKKRIPKPADTTERCGAKTRGHSTCQQPAGWGTDHVGVGKCKLHGGASTHPTYKRRMNELLTERAAQAEIVRLKLHADVDNPKAVLLEELRRSVGMVRYLERRVWVDTLPEGTPPDQILDRLPDHEPDLTVTAHIERFGIPMTEISAHPLWDMLHRERAHMVKVAESCHRAGIEQALVDANIAAGRMLVAVVIALVQRLGLDPKDGPVAAAVREVIGQAPMLVSRGEQS
jgi:hypothetical protein